VCRELFAHIGYERNKLMALDLYMVGLTVQDMSKSLAFYRRLGLALPEKSAEQQHIEVKMAGELTFFLDTRAIRSDNPELEKAVGDHRIILEFYLKSRAAVDAKYAELTGLGYQSYHTPFETPFGVYFALVNDPDGNTILLSA
jgi:predicted lactoylglutathione lyase